MAGLVDYLKQAVSDRASDLFIVAGSRVSEKVEKHLRPIGEACLIPQETERLISELYDRAGRSIEKFLEGGNDDFSLSLSGLARFRVHTYHQRGSMAAVVRVVVFEIPDCHEIHIPRQIMDLSEETRGLVLVTGAAGSGKSTTQACVLDRINRTRACHIITLEDPIEFLHKNQQSIVSQIEIAIDDEDYTSALRASLRQSPDVILLGEIEEHETIRMAMTAAEVGQLLFASMHTQGVVNTIERIVDIFPLDQQTQVRIQLSMVLNTVISQQLLPGIDGNLIPAYEIMYVNNAIRTLIREGKSQQIENAISAGDEGMVSMEHYLLVLYQQGMITKETALEYAYHPEKLSRRLE